MKNYSPVSPTNMWLVHDWIFEQKCFNEVIKEGEYNTNLSKRLIGKETR